MADEFDVIVLGGGPTGEHAIGRCADAGLTTAVVEHELVGGECSYWACMPSKTLLRPGQVLSAARRVPGAAQAVTGGLDVSEALGRRDWMTSCWDDKGQAEWLQEKGSTLVRGRGRLRGERTVEVDPGRAVPVDDTMCATTVPSAWLYAIGDVNGRALFTHMGEYHARVAVANIDGNRVSGEADHSAVPRVTFTDPQVASVGLTEAQARHRGVNVRTVNVGLESTAAASIAGEGVTGAAQLVIDESRQVVVGATLVGPDIDGILHSATVAIVGEVPMDRLWHAVPAFPTMSEVWLQLLLAYRTERSSADPDPGGASS